MKREALKSAFRILRLHVDFPSGSGQVQIRSHSLAIGAHRIETAGHVADKVALCTGFMNTVSGIVANSTNFTAMTPSVAAMGLGKGSLVV
jgi:hypothetical protein